MAQLHLWSKIRTKLSLDDGPFIIFAPDLWYFIDLDALFYKMFRILFIFEILKNTTEGRLKERVPSNLECTTSVIFAEMGYNLEKLASAIAIAPMRMFQWKGIQSRETQRLRQIWSKTI